MRPLFPMTSREKVPQMILSMQDAVRQMTTGDLSARVYCEQLLERIRGREAEVQAWATLDEARALARADECDRRRASGTELGVLHGVPVGVKDIISTADLPTEMGSPIFAGHQPERDAVLIERLELAGAFVLGKTVTTEFAFMHPGKTRNPWNLAHTPGGSSSGSAAAVAAGFVPAAIGTQTNGSVIRPAAFCGIVGFKPTFGLISFAGILPFSETLDQPGTFTRYVADAALLAAQLAEGEAIAPNPGRLERPPRLGALARFPWNDAEPEARLHFEAILDRLRAAGAFIEQAVLPEEFAAAQKVHRTIMMFEAYRNHGERQTRERARMSRELNEGLDAGRSIALDAYREAVAGRAMLIERAHDLFDEFDAILSPPAPGAAPASLLATGDPSFCTLWSLLGAPAIALPSGASRAGLPFGVQLACDLAGDARLLRVAGWCEGVLGFRGLA
jgi:Asp-tRNA(Asn)/Glu-tRNA(Gln) amidotransferase A subunit family amidase